MAKFFARHSPDFIKPDNGYMPGVPLSPMCEHHWYQLKATNRSQKNQPGKETCMPTAVEADALWTGHAHGLLGSPISAERGWLVNENLDFS